MENGASVASMEVHSLKQWNATADVHSKYGWINQLCKFEKMLLYAIIKYDKELFPEDSARFSTL